MRIGLFDGGVWCWCREDSLFVMVLCLEEKRMGSICSEFCGVLCFLLVLVSGRMDEDE